MLGDINKHLLTSDRTIMTGQRNDSTHVDLGEPLILIRVSYRNMGEELLIGVGVGNLTNGHTTKENALLLSNNG